MNRKSDRSEDCCMFDGTDADDDGANPSWARSLLRASLALSATKLELEDRKAVGRKQWWGFGKGVAALPEAVTAREDDDEAPAPDNESRAELENVNGPVYGREV